MYTDGVVTYRFDRGMRIIYGLMLASVAIVALASPALSDAFALLVFAGGGMIMTGITGRCPMLELAAASDLPAIESVHRA